jgi:hypothetical protein
LQAHEGGTSWVAFSADRRSLLSCGADGQVYLWGLRPAPPCAKSTPDALWAELAAPRAVDAWRAVLAMSEQPAPATFLREKISPAKPVAEDRLAKWIADLGSDTFAVREKASSELAELGEQAAPALRKALAGRPDLEVEKRLRRLLDALKKGPSPAELRRLRAVQVLELAGTEQARAVLRSWAGGAPEARLTIESKAALRRLGQSGRE